ncbi:hypothetical protein [Bacillus infantis]|uniref:hypothetical protein n=1 Tax=Bacillus infantis TaxID=324767 RepID=UPI003CF3B36E
MKKMFENFKYGTFVLLSIPIGLVMWLLYVNLVTFLDPVFTVVIGGAFWLLLAAALIVLLINIKDFIVSIFKDDDTRDEKGFKKNL